MFIYQCTMSLFLCNKKQEKKQTNKKSIKEKNNKYWVSWKKTFVSNLGKVIVSRTPFVLLKLCRSYTIAHTLVRGVVRKISKLSIIVCLDPLGILPYKTFVSDKLLKIKFARESDTFDIESDIHKIRSTVIFQCTYTHISS